MLKVTMHWYWFQILTMRFTLSLEDFTVYLDNNSFQYSFSDAKALSTSASVWYLASIASAGFLLMIPGASHFWSSGFSM